MWIRRNTRYGKANTKSSRGLNWEKEDKQLKKVYSSFYRGVPTYESAECTNAKIAIAIRTFVRLVIRTLNCIFRRSPRFYHLPCPSQFRSFHCRRSVSHNYGGSGDVFYKSQSAKRRPAWMLLHCFRFGREKRMCWTSIARLNLRQATTFSFFHLATNFYFQRTFHHGIPPLGRIIWKIFRKRMRRFMKDCMLRLLPSAGIIQKKQVCPHANSGTTIYRGLADVNQRLVQADVFPAWGKKIAAFRTKSLLADAECRHSRWCKIAFNALQKWAACDGFHHVWKCRSNGKGEFALYHGFDVVRITRLLGFGKMSVYKMIFLGLLPKQP